MGLRDTLQKAARELLGVSAYQPPDNKFQTAVPEAVVEKIRETVGGNLQSLPTTRLRWYLEDLERAQYSADAGYMGPAAQLCRAMRRDGYLEGLMKSRAKGLLRLPKRFYGDTQIAEDLRSRNGTRSVFDEMLPPAELELLDGDGVKLGIGVGEFIPVPGRSYPVFCRLEPEFLQYRWAENRWYFLSLAGALPITPGDGRWVLHVPGGRLTPWSSGLWPALGSSFINKEHAKLYRSNYCAKLANPARLAYAPGGATEAQRLGFFQKLLAWGVNTVLELPPGWEAKLLESNGRGWDVFQRQIETSDTEYMISIAGQLLTTKGGTGFDGQDNAEGIRQDLIQADGDALAYTLNTQALPQFILSHYGEEALHHPTIVEWDTGSGADKERETRTLGQSADAIARLTVALAPYGKRVDIDEMTVRFAIPTLDGAVVSAVMPAESAGEAGAGELKTAPAAPAAAPPSDGADDSGPGDGADDQSDDEEDAA